MAAPPDLGARITARLADAVLALADPEAGPFADRDLRPDGCAALGAALEALADAPPVPETVADVLALLDQALAAGAPAPPDAFRAGWQAELAAMRALLARRLPERLRPPRLRRRRALQRGPLRPRLPLPLPRPPGPLPPGRGDGRLTDRAAARPPRGAADALLPRRERGPAPHVRRWRNW